MRKRLTRWHTWSKVSQLFSGKGGFHVHTSRFIWITATTPTPLSAPLLILFSVELLELCTHSKISMLNVCQGRQMHIHVLGLEFPSHLYISRLATNMLSTCKGPICISQLNPVTVLSELSALKPRPPPLLPHFKDSH